MCGLHAHDKLDDTSTDVTSFVFKRPLPEDSTIDYIFSLCVILNFIYIWVKALEKNFAWGCCAYQDNTTESF